MSKHPHTGCNATGEVNMETQYKEVKDLILDNINSFIKYSYDEGQVKSAGKEVCDMLRKLDPELWEKAKTVGLSLRKPTEELSGEFLEHLLNTWTDDLLMCMEVLRLELKILRSEQMYKDMEFATKMAARIATIYTSLYDTDYDSNN